MLFIGVNSFGQIEKTKSPPCATDEFMAKLIKDNPDIQERLDHLNEKIAKINNNEKIENFSTITIPIIVYIIHDGSPIGVSSNITDEQVNAQINSLNNYFDEYGIKFCFATKAGNSTTIPLANPTDIQNIPGIIHINNINLSNHDSSLSEQQLLMNTAHPSIIGDKFLRIWVVNSIDGENSGINGYASIPPVSFSLFNGVVIKYNVFGDNTCNNCNFNLLTEKDTGKTLVHEIGHYLGLYHTFYLGCTGDSSLDCEYTGDHVCDTPPVSLPNYECTSNINTCIGDTPDLPDDIHNYMDYGNDECVNHFTNGQINRIRNIISLYRNELYTSDNLIYTGACNPENLISANFIPYNHSSCSGVSLTFESLLQSDVTYLWNFGDPSSGINNSSNIQNPIHIFNTSRDLPYTVTLIVTRGNESTIHSEQIFVTECNPIINQDSYWFVNRSSGLNFSSGIPTFDSTFPVHTPTANQAGSQCDSSGNLLFYTDGRTIWNRQHNNIGSFPAIHGETALMIVPKPGDFSKYYIFTQQSLSLNNSQEGFMYSLVNIDNNSNATISISNQAITFPSGYLTGTNGAVIGETNGVTAVAHCTGYWIITVLRKLDFYPTYSIVVYSLTNNGLNYVSSFPINSRGSLHASPNGNKILLKNTSGNSYVLDFDKSIGQLSTPTLITNTTQSTGSLFSPDSKLLYLSYNDRIAQYNLNSINMNADKAIITKNTSGNRLGRIQQGPDGKLYIGYAFTSKLAIIHLPNVLAGSNNLNNCFFSLDGPKKNFTPNNYIDVGLPNLINAKNETAYNSGISSYVVGCKTYKFFPDFCGTSFNWIFDDVNSGSQNTSILTNPIHTFSQNGNYIVKLRDGNNIIATTTIVISDQNIPTIQGSSSACQSNNNRNTTNNSISLSQGQTASWTITSGSGTIVGQNNLAEVTIIWTSLPGTITLNINDPSGCISTIVKSIASDCTIPICSTNLAFNNPQITAANYQASQNINTNTNYTVNNGIDINLKAGNSIVISPNAHIKSGSTFRAHIGPCTEPNTGKNSSKKSAEANLNNVSIYPNPTSGIINIEVSNSPITEITLNSIDGKLVHFKKTSNVNYYSLDLSSYEKGIYLLNLKTLEGKFIIKKIIKQ